MAAGSAELVKQMRDGKQVPQLRRVDCVDLMVEVLSDRGLHIRAAEGFLKTGIRAPFDKSGDVRICREAADLRRAANLRQKMDDAVAEVRAECKAGRLTWSYNSIRRLISDYATHSS